MSFCNDYVNITLFLPMFPFDPLENIRKPLVFWCFQGDQKGTLGRKGLRRSISIRRGFLQDSYKIFTRHMYDLIRLLRKFLEILREFLNS